MERFMFIGHGLNVVIVFWAAIAVIVVAGTFFSYRTQASHHRMLEKLAEKGQPIPPELLTGGREYRRYRNPIQSGIFLMCVGIALAVFFWAMGGGGDFFVGDHMPNWLPVIGIFPFMVGLARLLGGMFDRH
jgi:predicted anti-sigma-YlaC factor YlaD